MSNPLDFQLKAPTVNVGCEACGAIHDFKQQICPQCKLCFAYCVRDVGCKWFVPRTPAEVKALENLNHSNVAPASEPAKVVEVATALVANHNVKEAFECWVASSGNVTLKCSVDNAFEEFESFSREILHPIDVNKQYFKLDEVKGDIRFSRLETQNLRRNQNGEYVVVEGRKRTRIGKNVAVLG
jgi:hypothetical protein